MTDSKNIMTTNEIAMAEEFLFTKLKLDKNNITVSSNFENHNKSTAFLVEFGKDIEAELNEWYDNQKKPIYLRSLFFHSKTKKTFLDLVLSITSIQDGDKNIVTKKYFVNPIKEFTEDQLEDDYLLDSSEEETKETSKTTLDKISSNDLIEVNHVLFWNITKYLIYSESIMKYKIHVESAEN